MATERIEFINRVSELKLLDEKVQSWGTSQVVCLQGPGGIGKTRLLQEMTKRYHGSPNAQIIEIVDFDDPQFRLSHNVMHTIAQQLGYQPFTTYLTLLRELQTSEIRGVSQGKSNLRTDFLKRYFCDGFNEVSSNRRVIIRMDTAETIQDTEQFAQVIEMFATLRNYLCVIAGRRGDELMSKLQANPTFVAEKTLLDVGPLANAGMKDYLQKKQDQLYVVLDKEISRKLLILASGRPILIDLAVEWSSHNRPMVWLEKFDVKELERLVDSKSLEAKNRLKELNQQFEKDLIASLSLVRSKTDQLILVMAKIYPIDAEAVSILLDVDPVEADNLFQRASNWTFVKALPDGRIKLHDEFHRMVNQYVWPQFDPDGSREHRDSLRAIQYITNKTAKMYGEIQSLRREESSNSSSIEPGKSLHIFAQRINLEDNYWLLRSELLRMKLAVDLDAGIKLFEDEYKLCSTEFSSNKYAHLLIDPVLGYLPNLSLSYRLQYQEKRALYLTDRGNYKDAVPIYKELLEATESTSDARVNALIGYGNLIMRIGKGQQAIACLNQAKEIAGKVKSVEGQAKANLALGWVYRSTGNYSEAIRYYQKTYFEANQVDDVISTSVLQAQALNGLAYVHSLLQDAGPAMDNIREAISLWQQFTDRYEKYRIYLGQAYNTAGEVNLELGQPEQALANFELAWNIFLRVEGEVDRENKKQPMEWKSRCRSGRGKAYWMLKEYTMARQDLEWAAENATILDTPSVLLRLGFVYWDIDLVKEAIRSWERSRDQAQLVGDMMIEYYSVVSLARAAIFFPIEGYSVPVDFEKWYREDYVARFPEASFPVLDGLFFVYLGGLYLRSAQILEAIDYFSRGLYVLAKNDRIGLHLRDTLLFLDSRVLPRSSDRDVQQIGRKLLETWPTDSRNLTAISYFRNWSRRKSW